MRGVVFLVLNYLSSSFGQAPEARIVVTAQGPVRGYKDPTRNVFAFYGIPYATAPTGRDRYKVNQEFINLSKENKTMLHEEILTIYFIYYMQKIILLYNTDIQ